MRLFRCIWNKLMEIKQSYLELQEFHRGYWEMRRHYDTHNMTLSQIWSLPCNQYLYDLNKEQIDKEIKLEKTINLQVIEEDMDVIKWWKNNWVLIAAIIYMFILIFYRRLINYAT